MVWFITYCVLSVGFFVLGAKIPVLHWFWNSIFSLLASLALTYVSHRIVQARLCRARLRKAIKTGANEAEMRAIVEAAFGYNLDLTDPSDAWFTGVFVYLPVVIIAFVGLPRTPIPMGTGPNPAADQVEIVITVVSSVILRCVVALLIAIPVAIVVGIVANMIAVQRRMLEKVKKVIILGTPGIIQGF